MFKHKVIKKIYYICIIAGAIIAFYANAQEIKNTVLLILGLAFLMFGIYKISSGIPSKKSQDD